MFRVHLMVIVAFALSLATAQTFAQSLPIGGDGWTIVTPSHDSRMIYVSSSLGNDNNSGLSESAPKKTLAAGYALLRNSHPDWLLLRSGDTWHEAFPSWNKSGRSPSERMVVRSYGSGPRPRLLTGTQTGVQVAWNATTRNLVFMDLHMNAHTNAGTASASGFQFLNDASNVLIENCHTENFRVNMIFQAWVPSGASPRLTNMEVRRNIIVDALATNSAHAQGIFADSVDGLLMEENVFDLNGWSPSVPTANIYRHNVYVQTIIGGDGGCTGVVARGNISARASATGLMLRTGGIAEDNLFLQNPIGLQFGQTSGPASAGIVRNNVILDSRDISPTLDRGMGMNLSFANGMEVYGNIIAHQSTGTGNIQAIGVDGTHRNLTIRDNIVYNWNRPGGANGRSIGIFGTPISNINIRDNDLQQPVGGFMIGMWSSLGPAYTFRGNRYFSTNGGNNQFFQGITYSSWLSQSGESDSTWGARNYPEPQRDIAAYMASMGRPASLEAFMAEARKQSRHTWRPAYTAAAVNDWIRQGFGLSQTATCYANCDGSQSPPLLTIDDFTCFVTQFISAQSLSYAEQVVHYANCDGSTGMPVLNVEDFACFIEHYALGCH